MNGHRTAGRLLLLALALLLAAGGAPLLAQDPPVQPAEPADYGLGWYSIDGGGAVGSSGGPYTLSGTAGQPDAGGMSGGPYRLAGGFWAGLGLFYSIYLPLALR